MRGRAFKSYPRGSSTAGGLPAHLAPIVRVDADWIANHGSRAQRRRVARQLQRELKRANR